MLFFKLMQVICGIVQISFPELFEIARKEKKKGLSSQKGSSRGSLWYFKEPFML